MANGRYAETIVFILFVQLSECYSLKSQIKLMSNHVITAEKIADNNYGNNVEHPASPGSLRCCVVRDTIRYTKRNVMGEFFSSMSH